MAASRRRKPAKPKQSTAKDLRFHAFWSGSVSFGLVNVPVLVFPANRQRPVQLHLMSPDGALLERRYYCPRDGTKLADGEIVRGYELDDGSSIIVTDGDLEAIEPEKTRTIGLRESVHIAEIPPVMLERGYYLTPLKQSTKAYRLLAEAMERSKRAGVATFVMRDREYLVAIFALNGVLCAQTLRFHDEIRDPRSIGLPAPAPHARRRSAEFGRAIDALAARALTPEELADPDSRKPRAIIERKKRARKEIVQAVGDTADDGRTAEGAVDVDLLEMIRTSLRLTRRGQVARRSGARARRRGKHRGVQ